MERFEFRGLDGRVCCAANETKYLCARCRAKAAHVAGARTLTTGTPPTLSATTATDPRIASAEQFRAALRGWRLLPRVPLTGAESAIPDAWSSAVATRQAAEVTR